MSSLPIFTCCMILHDCMTHDDHKHYLFSLGGHPDPLDRWGVYICRLQVRIWCHLFPHDSIDLDWCPDGQTWCPWPWLPSGDSLWSKWCGFWPSSSWWSCWVWSKSFKILLYVERGPLYLLTDFVCVSVNTFLCLSVEFISCLCSNQPWILPCIYSFHTNLIVYCILYIVLYCIVLYILYCID